MSMVYTPHVCETPVEYDFRRSRGVPAYPSGTIWRCDDCERYWKFRHLHGGRYADWKLIQSWHLMSVLRLLRAETRPDYLCRKEQS